MALRISNMDPVIPGSLWKHIYTSYQDPDRANDNGDFLVGVRDAPNRHTGFGPVPHNDYHSYDDHTFMQHMLPLYDPVITKLRIQLEALLGFVKAEGSSASLIELQELLVQFEI